MRRRSQLERYEEGRLQLAQNLGLLANTHIGRRRYSHYVHVSANRQGLIPPTSRLRSRSYREPAGHRTLIARKLRKPRTHAISRIKGAMRRSVSVSDTRIGTSSRTMLAQRGALARV